MIEAQRESAEWSRMPSLSVLSFLNSDVAESDRLLNCLIEKFGDLVAFNTATVYAVRGDADRAFEWLERAYNARDSGLTYMKPHSLLGPLHADPRWPVFLRKLGVDQ